MAFQTLESMVESLLVTADKRGLSDLNPISFSLADQLTGDEYVVIVATKEPSHIGVPYNVTWISADPTATHYTKVFRRITILPSPGFNGTWEELTEINEIFSVPQFYDYNNTIQLGELAESFKVFPATPSYRGKVQLNLAQANSIAVSTNDSRMSDARVPVSHTHPQEPEYAFVAGPNSIVRVDLSTQPQPGHVLFVDQQSSEDPTLYIGKWRKPRVVDVIFSQPVVAAVDIIGVTSVYSGTTTLYTLRATKSDGTTLDVSSSAIWEMVSTDQPSLVTISSGQTASLIVQAFPTNVNSATVTFRARYTDPFTTVEFSDEHTVTVTLNPNAIPQSLSIFGPNSVNEGNSATFNVSLNYADGSNRAVVPDTFTSSNMDAGTLDSGTGIFIAPSNITQNYTTQLSASFTERGTTVTGNKTLQVVDSILRPLSASIQGSVNMNEGTSQNLSLQITYDNGNSQIKTVSTWTLDTTTVASITSAGVLTATQVTQNTTITARASYSENGTTVNASLNITVIDVPLVLTGISITGASIIAEGTQSNYTCLANFSDGSTQDVTAQAIWSLQDSISASIGASNGVVTANTVVTDTSNEVRASYSGFNATKTITIKDVPTFGRWGVAAFGGNDWAFIEANLLNVMPNNNDGNTFNINVPTGQYGYYAHPAGLGEATFTDTSTNFPGGWDGAEWPQGDVGSTSGPLTILRPTGQGTETWYLYRTDFDGIGNFTYRVDYASN